MIEGLYVLGEPDMCMFSFTSDAINVYRLADEMALINETLDALPNEITNMLLIDYFNDMYV